MTERGITSSLNTVLVSGHSVKPPPITYNAPAVSVRTAPPTAPAYFTVPPTVPPNVFITEVAIEGGAPSPVHYIKPAQLREPKYSNITSKAQVHAGRNNNTRCLPPVQNLTHMAIASYKRQEKEKHRNKQLQQNSLSQFGVVTHGLHDNQYTSKPKRQLVTIPLRERDEKSFQRHLLDLHAELSKKQDFNTNFGKHNQKHKPMRPTTPNSAYSGEGSVISNRSAPPTARSGVSTLSVASSEKSSVSASTMKSESVKSVKSTVSNVEENVDLPLISQRSQEQQPDNAEITVEGTLEELAAEDNNMSEAGDEMEDSIISEPYSHNSYSTSYSGSIISSSSYSGYTDVTRSGTGSIVSGSYYIGSDADHDRIVQLEESLRSEEQATRKVQRALADIQAKQQALLSKLNPEDREKLQTAMPPPSSRRSVKSRNSNKPRLSDRSVMEDGSVVETERKQRRHHHRRRHHRSSDASVQEDDAVSVVSHQSHRSNVSLKSVEMEKELRQKDKEITRLQGLMTEMASTIAKSDPKMLQVLKNVVDGTKTEEQKQEPKPVQTPQNSTRSRGSVYSNKSSIVFC
jgi:hypothetical protein